MSIFPFDFLDLFLFQVVNELSDIEKRYLDEAKTYGAKTVELNKLTAGQSVSFLLQEHFLFEDSSEVMRFQ